MSLLRGAESPTDGGTPQVQDTPTEQIGGDKVAHRVGGDLPKAVLIKAHQAQAEFLKQEINEQESRETRGAGMGPELLALHQQGLESHLAALATLGAGEMTTESPEREARKVAVPVRAMPELVPAAI